MSRTKINLAVALVGLCTSIAAGVFSRSAPTGVLVGVSTGVAIFIVRMLVDIRVNQERLPADPDTLIINYQKLKQGSCELARVIATAKYREISSFFAELLTGRITLDNLNEVYAVLRPLFCDLRAVKEIQATSHDELSEWLELESWWGKNYLDMNAAAVKRGVKVKRVFILRSDQERTSGLDVFRKNMEIRVAVKTALKQTISQADFNLASNCLIFYDDRKQPLYCLQAIHGIDGGFVSAFLHSEPERLKEMVEAYRRIENVAQIPDVT